MLELKLNHVSKRGYYWWHSTVRCWDSSAYSDDKFCALYAVTSLHWRHNERDGVSNHQPHDCLLKRLFRGRAKKTSKLRVTGLCKGNSPGTGEFPTQRASNAEIVSVWWRHHVMGPKHRYMKGKDMVKVHRSLIYKLLVVNRLFVTPQQFK